MKSANNKSETGCPETVTDQSSTGNANDGLVEKKSGTTSEGARFP